MKSIYKVILSIWISTLSFSVFALDAPTVLVPTGLNPGDQFYVMFMSSTTTAGNKTVDQYNTLVNTDANAQSIGPTDGLTWFALMNHVDVMATPTEQTLSLFAANTAAPVYTTAGGKIASNRADLFDGEIGTAISFEADGVTKPANTVWTGSNIAGGANFPLGYSAGATDPAGEGRSVAVDGTWIENIGSGFDRSYINSRIYAVSPLLVVPGPIAGNDVATVTVNVSVDIDVLANDSAGSDPIALGTVAVQTPPVHGDITAIDASTGVVTYLPNANYEGIDSFTYLVKDSNNVSSNIATVSINSPYANNDSATVTASSSVSINVLANDDGGIGTIVASTVALQSSPANGTAVVNTANGFITYTPAANYTGSDSFTYLVKDDNDVNSNIATVSITVTAEDEAPAASGGSGSSAMDWSLLMLFSVLSLLRVKVRK